MAEIEVFNRYEKKYIIDTDMAEKLRTYVAQYMETDKHNRDGKTYSICNIYYDTDNNDIITRSIQKPLYKEKLRLRGYGVPDLQDEVFIEIKKKFDGVVNKRRSVIVLQDAYTMMQTGKMPEIKEYMNVQILREIEYILMRDKLKPALYLAYDRYAFFEKDNSDFRLTFDTNVRARRENVRLECGDYGEKIFDDDVWIMEMKAARAVPLWFAHLLSENKLYPVSASKYGTEFIKTLSKEKENV